MPPSDLPPGWQVTPDPASPSHPYRLLAPTGQDIGLESDQDAAPIAWRLIAGDLAGGHDEAPHPVPVGLIRALCDLAGGQRQAARLLRLGGRTALRPGQVPGERTVREWCSGDRAPSHAQVEILRLYAAGRWP